MLNLRINPLVAKDLKEIRDYIAEDNAEYAAKTIKEIYGKFENVQMFPGIGADLSKRVSFRTDYKYAVWENYVIICELPRLNTPYLKSRLLGCLRIRLRRLIFKSPPIARQSLFL